MDKPHICHRSLRFPQGMPRKPSAHCSPAALTHKHRICHRLPHCQGCMVCMQSDLDSAALQRHTVCRVHRSQPSRMSSSRSIAGLRPVFRLLHTLDRRQFHLTCYRLGSFDKHFDRHWARSRHRMGCSRHHRRCIGLVRSCRNHPVPDSLAYQESTTDMTALLHPLCHRCGDVCH